MMARTATKTRKKSAAGKAGNLELDVFDMQGKKVGKFALNKDVFDGQVNQPLVHQATVAYLSNQRKGLAATKTRGEVRGGGRKPWRQKGTGRARVGSIRSPIWRGGGVTFGSRPRSYYRNLPRKMKLLALKSALNAKFKSDGILILKELKVSSHKTQNFYKIIDNLKLAGMKVRLVVDDIDRDLKLSARNIKSASLAKASDLHSIEVADCKKIVLTESSLRKVETRIKSEEKS